MSKYLFFLGPVLNDWQVAPLVEQIEENKNINDCSIIYCSYNNGRCTSNIFGSKLVCKECSKNVEYIRAKFYSKLKFIPVIQKDQIKREIKHNIATMVSAISTVNSNLRPVQNEWTENQEKILNLTVDYGESFYNESTNLLDKADVDKIFFYNGRVFPASIIELGAKAKNIEYIGLELNSSGTQYYTTANHKIHDIDKGRDHIRELIRVNYTGEEHKIANKFFEENFARQKNYKKFDTGEIYNKDYIAIFTSSDDELSSLGPEWGSLFTKSISQSIEKIISRMSDEFFIIRLHPNQMGQGDKVRKIYEEIQKNYNNVKIIYPSDKVNSYSIINASKCVISFGSTISVEATFLKKPSILLGVQKYDRSGVVYTPDNFEQLYLLLKNKNLEPCNISGAYAYALYSSRAGASFRQIQGDVGRYKLNNIYLIPRPSIFYLFVKIITQLKYKRKDKGFRSIARLALIKLRLFNLKNDKSIW
jgi:hypothetical protein